MTIGLLSKLLGGGSAGSRQSQGHGCSNITLNANSTTFANIVNGGRGHGHGSSSGPRDGHAGASCGRGHSGQGPRGLDYAVTRLAQRQVDSIARQGPTGGRDGSMGSRGGSRGLLGGAGGSTASGSGNCSCGAAGSGGGTPAGNFFKGVHGAAERLIDAAGLQPLFGPIDAAVIHPLLWDPLSALTGTDVSDHPEGIKDVGYDR